MEKLRKNILLKHKRYLEELKTICRGKIQMRTLDELLYYCEEPEPVGAILLTGEWGCGKTYLIDNDLKDALENKDI